jgi:4-amino-4-deoxy-L-arabinose transferase-like glycosyltransferase
VVTADKISEMQATDLRLQRARNINDSNLNDFPHITHHSSLITHHSVFISVLVLTILSAFLFFYRLADRDLWSSHEGRAAQDAETILEDGHWGLPRLFDRKYVDLQKPPLYYWLVAAIAFIRGRPVDEWAVRLPSALAAAGSGLLLYWFGVHRGRPRAALAAALILVTAVHYTWLARVGRIDMPLTLAMSVAVICFYAGWNCMEYGVGRRFGLMDNSPKRKRGTLLLPSLALRAGIHQNESGDPRRTPKKTWPWFLVAYVSVAIAILLKGPVGLVLPAAVMAAWLFTEGELPAPWRIRSWLTLVHRLGLWWGLPLILLIAGSWFFWAAFQTDGELGQSLWYHNVVRAVGGIEKMRARPLLFYIPRLAMDFLPWSVLLPVAGWYVCRQNRWRLDSEARFGLIWLLSMMAVLSCVGFKRADYLVPAYPGAALFLGCVGERWLQAARHSARLMAASCVAVAGCLLGWWIHLVWILPREEGQREDRTFAAVIRRYAPAPDPVIFFRVEAHTLAFHTGRPIDTLLEWENLDFWAGQPRPFYVVMDSDCAREWPQHLRHGSLEPVTGNVELADGKHDHPLVLMRTHQTAR